jgi:L,D-peptidoglycan transpeptidase YkuD (ErfK/YbiS/YcfS/YnhG family)
MRGQTDAGLVYLQSLSRRSTTGFLISGNLRLPCALGRSGISAGKREGDGATPQGRFAFKTVQYRSDRVGRPATGLAVRALRGGDGWCDAVGDRNYNRPVQHPYAASAERMWRSDHLYDLVVVLDHNQCPRVQGRGSAIFMHVARPGLAPTEGCLALRRADLVKLLVRLRPGSRVAIGHKQLLKTR